jgi:hypothetical protein
MGWTGGRISACVKLLPATRLAAIKTSIPASDPFNPPFWQPLHLSCLALFGFLPANGNGRGLSAWLPGIAQLCADAQRLQPNFSPKASETQCGPGHSTNRSDAEAPVDPSHFSHYRVNGWWEYKGRRIVDNGFILFGPSDALHDFMKGHNRPYILKTETQTETVSLFSNQGSEVDLVYIGDLEDSCEIISRIYSFLRPGAIFGTYTVTEFAGSFSHSRIDVLGNFLKHISQN